MATKKSRSGTQWGDAEYAANGYARLSIRLPVEDRAVLDELAEMSGWTVTETVVQLARAEQKRRKARASKKST